MWWLLWCVAGTVLAAGAVGDTPETWQCPAECACGGTGLTEVTCGQRIYRVRDDGYAEVDCQGVSLSCADIPPLPRVRTLHQLELTSCKLERGAGGCVSGAVGGAPGGPPRLYTKMLAEPLTEETLHGLHNVQKLFMYDAFAESSLPPLRTSLPSLQSYRMVGGRGVQLSPHALPPSLRYLEVMSSGVTSLHPDTFAQLTQLNTLNLVTNDIRNVTYEQLAPLTSLRELSLNFNPVESVKVSRLSPLMSLSLSHVHLTDLRRGDVTDLPHLQHLTIKSTVPLTLHERSLSSLPSLVAVSLTQSGVTSLPPSLFENTTAVVNITFSWNNITHVPDTLFYNMSGVQRIDLSHNSLSSLSAGTFDSLLSLTHINLDYNYIHAIPSRLFTSCVSLEWVSLSHNWLTSLPPLAFPLSLSTLLLSHNRLSWSAPGDGDAPSAPGAPLAEYAAYSVYSEVPSPFNSLVRLQTLDLSHNSISYMFPDFRHVLIQELRYLDLSYNAFTDLSAGDTQFLNLNLTVDLRHNNITRVEPYIRPTFDFDLLPPSPSPSLRILLSDNPFTCDCYLYPLLSNMQSSVYDVTGAKCASPPGLRGAPLPAVPPAALACPLPVVPPNCTCVYRPHADRYECECSAVQPASLPDPRPDGVAHLTLTLTQPNEWTQLPPYVDVLNVSHTNLTQFLYNVTDTLHTVDLSHNELHRIPSSLLDGNYTLLLSGNPIRCDCWNSAFILELQRHAASVLDYDTLTCSGGGRVGAVDARALCDVVTIVGSSVAAAVVVVGVGVALCWRYSRRIRAYLAALPGLQFLETEEGGEEPQFDVFVSFSHEDFPWVRDVLLPALERTQRVCVHYREWRAGVAVAAQILRSVATSRRTLAVLSPRYLRSRWALAELRAAAQRGRLLAVLLEPLPAADLPADVRHYLTHTTYLEVSDPRFWDKLRRALPRRPLGPLPEPPPSPPPPVPIVPPTKPVAAIDVVLNENGQLVNRGFVKDV